MLTFLVRRRGIAGGANELDAALTRLRDFEDARRDPSLRWLHSYALREADGRFGLACLFAAADAPALRLHAAATRLPAEAIAEVTAADAGAALDPAGLWWLHWRATWPTAARRDAALQRLQAADPAPRPARYALREPGGRCGAACLLRAADAAAAAWHLRRCGLPAAEATPVLGRIVFSEVPLQPVAPATGRPEPTASGPDPTHPWSTR
ncbi:MAG: hypothetical protein U1F50_04655 [Rubrivivax sp.]